MTETSIIVDKYLGYLKDVYQNFDRDFLLIRKACDIAQIAHEGQYRKLTGTPFVAHPMRVAVMIAKRTDNLPLILAAILHDVVEDAFDKFSMSYIYDEFGDEVGFLVDAVTDNILYYNNEPSIIFDNKIDKLLSGAIKDARCLFLKLMDREHNNKTLDGLKTDKQIRKSFETQALYNPLKKILKVDHKNFVLEDINRFFSQYMNKNNISNIEELKSSLYMETFEDINSDNFNLFYYNSGNIVWKIKDKKMFNKLIKNNYFDDKIDMISLTEDINGNFNCLFKYKEGKICCQKVKMSIFGFKY